MLQEFHYGRPLCSASWPLILFAERGVRLGRFRENSHGAPAFAGYEIQFYPMFSAAVAGFSLQYRPAYYVLALIRLAGDAKGVRTGRSLENVDRVPAFARYEIQY